MEILDSTLREGEQSPEVSFTPEQRLELAIAIDELGVEFIEAGHPAVSEDVFKGIKSVASQGLNAKILAHSRARREDIDLVLRTDASWIGIFFCVSNRCLSKRFHITLEEAVARVVDSIDYAKSHGLKVRFTPEDTTRTEWENLEKVIQAAVQAGVDRISVADTTGVAHPWSFYSLVSRLREFGVPLHVHCHNDMGLALANAIMGIEAGAILVDATVNGIGERTGIVDLAQITTIANYHYGKNYNLEMLPLLSKKLQEITGLRIEKNRPIVGDFAFVHKAGLHVAAVIRDPYFYEFLPPEFFGRNREIFVDKYAGRASLEHYLHRVGIRNEKVVEKLLRRIKSSNMAYTPEMIVEEAKRIEKEVM